MKKFVCIALALVMMLGCFAACGGGDNGDTSTPAPEDSAAPESEAPESEAPESEEPSAEPAEGGASGTFKIGGIGPLTGDAAIYGTAVKNAIEIAAEEVNAKGGVQFEVQFEDDVSDPETSANAYNKLLDDGMQILIGTVTTGPCLTVSQMAYEDRVFALTPSASSPDVTAGKDNMFQVCFTDPNQGSGAATYMGANMADSKIAVIYRNDDAYSQGIRDTFIAQAETENLDVVYEGTFTADTATDFSVQLTAAQSAGADLIFLPIYYQPASVILAQAKAMNYNPTFFGVDGMDGILTMPGFDTSLAEGVMLLTPFSADAEDDLTKNFVAEYQERFGEVPNQFAADAYDAVYIILDALNAAGCTGDMSYADICEALVAVMPTITYTGLTGSDMTWDASGAVTKMPTAVVIENGVYVGA